jgi:hypothetical protein
MAKAVVSAWTACVKDLQQLVAAASASTPALGTPDSPTTRASSELSSFMQRVKKLNKQPPLSHAAWKKLVQDVQVICWGTNDPTCAGYERTCFVDCHSQSHRSVTRHINPPTQYRLERGLALTVKFYLGPL